MKNKDNYEELKCCDCIYGVKCPVFWSYNNAWCLTCRKSIAEAAIEVINKIKENE